jgi:hypothetical protein
MNEWDLKQLEEKYVLLKRSRLWAFLGGVIFTAVAFGIISYQGAITAVEEFGGKNAIERIREHEVAAAELHTQIADIAEDSRRQASQITSIVDKRIEWHRLKESREDARLKRLDTLAALKKQEEVNLSIAQGYSGPVAQYREPVLAATRARIQQIEAEMKALKTPN